MESKLYVYEFVISRQEWDDTTNRETTNTDWEAVGEQLTDLLEATAIKFIEDNRRT